MPYSNFDDTAFFRSIYQDSQKEDNDIDVCEFILNKLLVVGEWFDEGDDDKEIPLHQQAEPIHAQLMQAGFLFCTRTILGVQNEKPVPEKPICLFRENMFSFDYHVSVFHPPALVA